MADDEEEDDYMSDAFLLNDHKPGLMPKCFVDKHKRVEQGKERGKLKKTKSIKVHAAEQRDEKLNKALDESNKGFAMLSKMGFKYGMGLGKQGQGRAEPIPIEFKQGRKGLGKDSEDNRRKHHKIEAYKRMALKRKANEANLSGDYKNRMRNKLSERQTETDLNKSQTACSQLDNKKEMEPEETWMWPPVKVVLADDEDVNEEEEEEIDEPETEEKLVMLTSYLREIHFYCVWCGVEFEDEKDLSENCPGNTREYHDD